MFYITAVRMVQGGRRPEHISEAMWLDTSDGKTAVSTVANIVKFIQTDDGKMRVGGPTGPAEVRVVARDRGEPYLRTTPDETTADNLLALPRY